MKQQNDTQALLHTQEAYHLYVQLKGKEDDLTRKAKIRLDEIHDRLRGPSKIDANSVPHESASLLNVPAQMSESTGGNMRATPQLTSSGVSGTLVGHGSKQYIRHPVLGDDDCGYTAFGITRSEAFGLLTKQVNDVGALLQPVVAQLLATKAFYNYLIENERIPKTTSFDAIQHRLDDYSVNLNVITGYIHYEVNDKRHEMGWAHPAILQALAHIQKIEIHMWQLGENQRLEPHRRPGHYDYSSYKPNGASQRLDLLYVNGNHFERLSFAGFDNNDNPNIGDNEEVYPLRLQTSNLLTTATIKQGENIMTVTTTPLEYGLIRTMYEQINKIIEDYRALRGKVINKQLWNISDRAYTDLQKACDEDFCVIDESTSSIRLWKPEFIYMEELVRYSSVFQQMQAYYLKAMHAAKGQFKHAYFSFKDTLFFDEMWSYIEDNVTLETLEIVGNSDSHDHFNMERLVQVLQRAPNLFLIDIHIFGKSILKKAPCVLDTLVDEERFLVLLEFPRDQGIMIRFRDRDKQRVYVKQAYNKQEDNCVVAKKTFCYPIAGQRSSLDSFINGIAENFSPFSVVESIVDGWVNVDDSERLSSRLSKDTLFSRSGRLIHHAVSNDDSLSIRLLDLMGSDVLGTEEEQSLILTPLETAAGEAGPLTLAALLGVSLPLPVGPIQLLPHKAKLLESKNKLKLTPLLIAAQNGKTENVQLLLRCGANISGEKNPAKLALDHGHEACALVLFKAGCLFPDNMQSLVIKNTELQSFIDTRRAINTLIDNNNLEEIKKEIECGRFTRDYLSLSNKSAAYLCIKARKFSLYGYLFSKGFRLLVGEKEDTSNEAAEMEKAIKPYFFNQDSTIIFLLAKTRIVQDGSGYFGQILDAFTTLFSIPEIRPILNLLRLCDTSLEIIVDFENNNIREIFPETSSDTTVGACRPGQNSHTIFIAAKAESHEWRGTLAHELTHLAMQVLFANNCNPYGEGESDIKANYFIIIREILAHLLVDADLDDNTLKSLNPENVSQELEKKIIDCIDKSTIKIDPVVKRAFLYPCINWPAEIIVRVPHILARDNHIKNNSFDDNTKKLLDFFSKTIVEACKKKCAMVSAPKLVDTKKTEVILKPHHRCAPSPHLKVYRSPLASTRKLSDAERHLCLPVQPNSVVKK